MNEKILNIAPLLAQWYAQNKRNLPWRETTDAYAIWLSEIILQQTRVEQGMPYYYRFLAKYPTVHDFAAANQDEILKLWQGLGYYSRARNMQQAAQLVVDEYGGVFPADWKKIRALKGVGDYTAAAILSFAYGMPHAVVDGNVLRVLARLYAISQPIDTSRGKKLFSALAQAELDKKQPATHNQAIMDLGALVCTPKAPKCGECPLATCCAVHLSPKALSYPIKKAKVKISLRYFNYLVCQDEKAQYIYLHQRTEKDIWQGLYEFPLLESPEKFTDQQLAAQLSSLDWIAKSKGELQKIGAWQKQVLSHQHIHYRFVYLRFPTLNHTIDKFLTIDLLDIANFAVPKPMEKEIQKQLASL